MRALLLTRTRELPVSAVAGGLAVLGGVALWQLGIEFERAWLRSCDGPLLGELSAGESIENEPCARFGQTGSVGRERRWVATQQPRRVTRAAPVIGAHRR